jgi:hypothetical protein
MDIDAPASNIKAAKSVGAGRAKRNAAVNQVELISLV